MDFGQQRQISQSSHLEYLPQRWSVKVEMIRVLLVVAYWSASFSLVVGFFSPVVALAFLLQSIFFRPPSLLTGAWKVKPLLNSLGGRQPPCHGGCVVHLVFDSVHSFIFLKTNLSLLHAVLNRRSLQVPTEGFPPKTERGLYLVYIHRLFVLLT